MEGMEPLVKKVDPELELLLMEEELIELTFQLNRLQAKVDTQRGRVYRVQDAIRVLKEEGLL